jgi:hypothetical protein
MHSNSEPPIAAAGPDRRRAAQGAGPQAEALAWVRNATIARFRRKKMKRNERKNKQNCFHFFSFSFPNRGFSMGYGRKNKKFRQGLNSPIGCVGTPQMHACLDSHFRASEGSTRSRSGEFNSIARISGLRNELQYD